jgi:hypothetical protein
MRDLGYKQQNMGHGDSSNETKGQFPTSFRGM